MWFYDLYLCILVELSQVEDYSLALHCTLVYTHTHARTHTHIHIHTHTHTHTHIIIYTYIYKKSICFQLYLMFRYINNCES